MGNRFVEKLGGLSTLDAADVAAIGRDTAGARRIGTRVDLIREGDRPGAMFVILEGWACRYKILPGGTRQVLAFLMPGDACDLNVGLLAEMDHSIQTITPALVATVARATMDAMMAAHPNVARAMQIAQLVDAAPMRAWLISMGRRSSTERVAHLMCELYLRARISGVISEAELEVPLSQLLLADALGMTPVHLNRVLKALRQTGAMDLKRGKLIIADPVKLVRIAGFDENYLHRRLRTAA